MNDTQLWSTMNTFQSLMRQYIADICAIDGCRMPNISETTTCDAVINYRKTWNNKLSWNADSETDTYTKKGRTRFIESYPDCGAAVEIQPELEFFYRFAYQPSADKLSVFMHVCCGIGKRFGSDYAVPDNITLYDEYEPNNAWYDHNNIQRQEYKGEEE
eukprot:149546_1